MSEFSDAPTCETGFWEPLHSGCPVCGPNGPCRDPEYEALIQANLEGKRRANVARFFLCLFIALVPLMLVPMFDWLGAPMTRTNAGWAFGCTILLLGQITYLVCFKGWRADA